MAAAAALALLVLALPARGDEPAAQAEAPVTFSNQIARLFQRHCVECHRPGDIAPFALTSYREAYRHREDILEQTQKRLMPPWKPVPGHGEFTDVRRLPDADVDLIARWVHAGAPEGDRRDLPPERRFEAGWRRGLPDVVLRVAAPFTVPPSRDDLYRCFVIPTSFPEDRYVTAVEVRPGERKVVHHVLTYLDTEGHAEPLDAANPGEGYPCFGGPGFRARGGLGGWAPGAPPQVMPERVGMLLPRGARVVVQVHYHNRGRDAVQDQTQVALYFARGPIDKRVRVIPVLDRTFVIPASARRHEVRASYTLQPTWNMHAIAVTPHMHLLGREMTVTATYPDGTTRSLIRIDDWDFHWQGGYTFKEPVPLPGGTRIDVVAIYDNSADNPRQPNRPPRDVTWGENTTDEMCIAFIRVTVDAERLGHLPVTAGR
jgi:mono/diheme cytochrome c family protein